MDSIEDMTKIGGAFAPLLKFGANWKAGTYAKEAGEQQQAAKDLEARMARARGGQEFAASQREMLQETKKERLVQSALQARAAAQGGASDPSVIKAAEDIAAEGSYRAATALYKGEDMRTYLENVARMRNYEGAVARRTGEIKKQAYRTQAFTSLLGGLDNVSWFAKYGSKPTANFVAPALKNSDLFTFDEMASP